jgi:hypothetical protein
VNCVDTTFLSFFLLSLWKEKRKMSAGVNDDPRLGALIVPGEVGDIVVVGFPSDEGVKRNGGRPGAAGSPSLFFFSLGLVPLTAQPQAGLMRQGST